jgi:hypothetical protein
MQLNLFRLQENVRIDPHDYRGYTNDDTGGGAALFLVRATTVPAGILINGGFEIPPVNGNGEYEHRKDDELTGWTLSSTYRGTVHFDTDYAPVSEGSQAVQIEVPGDWISQDFNTIVGQEYQVSFDLSAYPVYGGPNLGYTPCNPYCDSILEVSVGSESEVFTGSSEEYVTHTLLFTADSAISTVKFENPFILDINDEWGNYPHLDNVSVSMVATQVTIDIKPGSDPNCFNINSHGVIPVAILGSDSFDVTEIAQESLSFGGLEVRVRGNKGPLCRVDYSDGDEYLDLVCQFEDSIRGQFWLLESGRG